MKFWMYEKAAKSYCFFDRFAASGEDGQPLSDPCSYVGCGGPQSQTVMDISFEAALV